MHLLLCAPLLPSAPASGMDTYVGDTDPKGI
jgi:hypothetical protein